MVNPYTETLARALYRKEQQPIDFPVDDRATVKDAIVFMNGRTFVARFRLNMEGNAILIDYLDQEED